MKRLKYVNKITHYLCGPCGLQCNDANLCPWCMNRMRPVFKPVPMMVEEGEWV